MNRYFIYIMCGKNRSFHVGMTDDLKLIISSAKSLPDDEKKKLVFYEIYESKTEAEERLKDINGWFKKKIALVVDLFNPGWDDWGKEFLKDDFQKNIIYS